MVRAKDNSATKRIFENLLFLAEVFSDPSGDEIPKVPLLELARSFELSYPRLRTVSRRRRKDWRLWK